MKKLLSLLTASAIAVGMAASVYAADDITVLVDDKPVEFPDAKPFIENDFTLVPMRAIFESLGASVNWDGDTKTVLSHDPLTNKSIVMQIGQNYMFVNNTKVDLEVTAKIVDDSTVVPVRAISESLDCDVDWVPETKTVVIKRNTPQAENPWLDYESIEAVNSAINESGDVKFTIADLKDKTGLTVDAYRYMPTGNISEIVYKYAADDESADVTVRTMPGDTDISGIYGATKLKDDKVLENAAEIYSLEDHTMYITWSCENPDVISHCVIVESDNMKSDSMETLLKKVAEDIETNHPRG